MTLIDLTAAAVESALEEFDQIGREAFLAKYGFGPSRTYFLDHNGKQYDSKAIAGAAHGYLSGHAPLEPSEFSGGEQTVAAKLRELGFEVRGTARGPTWSRDELILALELYMADPISPPGKASKEIAALSETLGRLGAMLGLEMGANHRNPNGVYMKVMNFRRFDPRFTSAGKSGLTHGGAGDEDVWNEFVGDLDRLSKVANLIRTAISKGALQPSIKEDDDYLAESAEGRVVTTLHKRRERSRKLVWDRKRKALDETGELRCEGCGMTFEDRYGSHGSDFIEVHHTKPVSTMEEGEKTRLEDLALVCANCHRMIHKTSKWLSMDQLRGIVKVQI